MKILAHYGRDVEAVIKHYTRNKEDPPVARDMPPIAGKIAWARQLFRRIQGPMEMFESEHQALLKTPEAKTIIKNYNKLAETLNYAHTKISGHDSTPRN